MQPGSVAVAAMAQATPAAAADGGAGLPPQVVSIQPCAIVDHLCLIRDEAELRQLVNDEVGACVCAQAAQPLGRRCAVAAAGRASLCAPLWRLANHRVV